MSQSSSRMSRWSITLLVLCALVASALPIPAARATGIRPIQPAATSTASITRVSPTGSTKWPCGTSWGETCTLQTALTNAAAGDEIWVGAGVHKPTTDTDRTVTFQLRGNVAIYGGFAMTETLRSQRNPATNVTVLSGDLGTVGNGDDNSYHVVTGSGVINVSVDGFTVTGGNANGDSVYSNDRGGGLYNNHSNLTLTNVTFSDNTAANYGGGLYNNSGNSTLTSVTFSGNSAGWGGGLFNASANGTCNHTPGVTIINSTFSGNSAGWAGGIYNSTGVLKIDSSTIVANVGDGVMSYNDAVTCTRVGSSIIAGNSGSDVSAQDTTQRFFSLGYNIIGTAGNNVNFNLEFNQTHDVTNVVNPLVAPLAANGGSTWTMALLPGSPAIDRGSAACPATDQRGVTRPQGPVCDSGAFEYEYHVRYASPTAIGAGNCTSWANACTLQTALTGAAVGDEVWVATGVYTPGLAITATFQLKSGVGLYGGFAMTETLRDQRNPAANVTVLSGDIDGNDLTDPHGVVTNTANITGTNAYHVVTASGVTTTAVLDGFTVTGGNANSASPNNVGGGLYTSDGSPTLMNVTFSGNAARDGGGGLFNGPSSPTLTNVTFSGNTVQVNGGGLYNGGGTPTLTNVTFSGNLAGWGGGGMFSGLSNPTLTNVTFSGNTANNYGGGMNNYSGSNPTIRNTILWGNTAPNGAQAYNQNSTPTISDSVVQGGCPGGSTCSSVVSADPRLGALGNYGGGTQTVALLPGSSAIDAGNDAVCPGTDQRGVARPQGAHCDIGAFESRGFTLIKTGDDNQITFISTAFSQPLTVTLSETGGLPLPGETITFTAPASGASIAPPITVVTKTNASGLVALPVAANGMVGAYTVTVSTIGADNVGYHLGNIGALILYAKPGGLTSGLCASWANACDLRYALTQTVADSGQEVWAAAGVHTPGLAITATFQLKSGAGLYGGFAMTETLRSQRNPAANVTVLSGDLDGNDLTDAHGVVTSTANITGANAYHVVTASGVTTTAVLDGFTITGGNAYNASAPNNYGGGMHIADGDPTLINIIFSGNSAYYGGGMSSKSSNPTLINVAFSGNTAPWGAGLYNTDGGPTLTNVTFSGNIGNWGGGLYNGQGSPILTNVTFSGNTAIYGGGILNFGGGPILTNVTFSGNSAVNDIPGISSNGGGMYNDSSSLMLTNITFSANSATNGGGLYNTYGSSPMLTNVTFSSNSATNGGGLYNTNGSNPPIRNTILWGNTAITGAQVYNTDSTPVISDSVVQNGCPSGSSCSNLITADPLLDVLDNYGRTSTIALLPGSSAIDAGNDTVCPGTDQRGVARPQGAHCDIGAFESRGFTLIKTGGDNQSTLINTAFSQSLMVSVTSVYAEPMDGGRITFAGPLPGASTNPITTTAIITDGAAAQWVTANNVTGAYSVIASANGVSLHLTYNLTNIITHHVYLPLVIKP